MSSRLTDEERATQFFENADLAVAQTTFNICKGIMKRRNLQAGAGAAAPVKRVNHKRKPRKPGSAADTDTVATTTAA